MKSFKINCQKSKSLVKILQSTTSLKMYGAVLILKTKIGGKFRFPKKQSPSSNVSKDLNS